MAQGPGHIQVRQSLLRDAPCAPSNAPGSDPHPPAADLTPCCRHGLQVCSSSKEATPSDLAQCRLALGLALGSMARMTVVPQKERSDYR